MCSNDQNERLTVIDPASLDSAPRERTGNDEPAGATGSDRRSTIVGVLLAAGTSSRFGSANKLLTEVNRKPIVRRAAATLCASAVDRVVVVVGYEATRVKRVLEGLDVAFVKNSSYPEGQSTSVRKGVSAACERGASAVVIALGDMPAVRETTIDALIDTYRADAGDALAAACEGQRGNPVLFDRRYFDALRDVSGDTGGREILLEGGRSALVECDDPGVLRDVDTETDLDDHE